MTPALVARLIEGARAGSLALTRTEAIALVREITPGASVIVDGRPVDLRSLPWHVFPDHVAELPELDPWRRQAHESLVEGLIDGEDQRRLFEVADQESPESLRHVRRPRWSHGR